MMNVRAFLAPQDKRLASIKRRFSGGGLFRSAGELPDKAPGLGFSRVEREFLDTG
jgi:hypothetical protein